MASMTAVRPVEETRHIVVQDREPEPARLVKIVRPCPRGETPLARAAAEVRMWTIDWPKLDMAQVENSIGTPLSLPREVGACAGR